MNAIVTESRPASPLARLHPAALVGGALALVAAGALATAAVFKWSGPADASSAATPVAAASPTPGVKAADGAPDKAGERPAERGSAAPARAANGTRSGETGAARSAGAEPARAGMPTSSLPVACANCGVVESVTPVQRKGEGTGLGAVAGGVIGGVIGNQMGGGSGKQAMTVIGAVGGGVAGHEIEKRARSTTEYQLRIRMADGTLRTVTQARSIAVGQPVQVDGQKVTPVANASRDDAPRSLQTSART